MGAFVLTDARVEIGGTDVSEYVRSVSYPIERELVERTTMGNASRRRIPGLKDSSVTIEFVDDHEDDKIDEILWDAFNSPTPTAIKVRHTSAAIGVNNPEYSGNYFLESHPAVDGSVGDLATKNVTFQGDGDVTRAIST